MTSTGLIVIGTVVGGLTANPAIIRSISGADLALRTFSETKDYKKKNRNVKILLHYLQ